MGLGKTIMALALIHECKEMSERDKDRVYFLHNNQGWHFGSSSEICPQLMEKWNPESFHSKFYKCSWILWIQLTVIEKRSKGLWYHYHDLSSAGKWLHRFYV